MLNGLLPKCLCLFHSLTEIWRTESRVFEGIWMGGLESFCLGLDTQSYQEADLSGFLLLHKEWSSAASLQRGNIASSYE